MIKLPNKTAQLLSSGQVVSSISNAVKELVENSLDASADVIEVKLENGGLKKIEVRDNGAGIKSTEVTVAAQRHYTSKITSHLDLQKLDTYGFRGEALSSLCEIADVFITTRTKDEPYSVVYELDSEGLVKSKKPSHIAQGTTVTVLNLFKNLPVRKQFFSCAKKIKEQLKLTEDLLMAFSISQHAVHFKLINDRCVIWQKPITSDSKLSFLQVLESTNIQLHCLENYCNINKIRIRIFFPKKYIKRKSKDRFFLFINKRPIQNKKIEKLVRQNIVKITDQTTVNPGWPAVLVVIDVPPSVVDVNVNPNKTEAHLSVSQAILDLLNDMFESYRPTSKSDACLTPIASNDNNSSEGDKSENSNVPLSKTLKTTQFIDADHQTNADALLGGNALNEDSSSVLQVNCSSDETGKRPVYLKNNNFANSDEKENASSSDQLPSISIFASNKVCSDSDSANTPREPKQLKLSDGLGTKSWSCGNAVTNDSGEIAHPVKIIRPSVLPTKQSSNNALKQTTLNVAVKRPVFEKPRTVSAVSMDTTEQRWEDLNKDDQQEMIDIACAEYDCFTREKTEVQKKKKVRKSFIALPVQNNGEDESSLEPEVVHCKFDFKAVSTKISSWVAPICQNDKVKVIGYLDDHNAAVLEFQSKYLVANLHRLQETVIFQKLSETFKVPSVDLERTIDLSPESAGADALECLQTMAFSAVTQLKPDADILDKRILHNGFKVKKLYKSADTFQLYAIASSIPCYGLKDLVEVLLKINADKHLNILKSRPRKCMYYLQAEASRIARSSPVLASTLEILDALKFLRTTNQTWDDFFSTAVCFHMKNLFHFLDVKS